MIFESETIKSIVMSIARHTKMTYKYKLTIDDPPLANLSKWHLETYQK